MMHKSGLLAMFIALVPAVLSAQMINSAGAETKLVVQVVAPCLNITQREQVIQRIVQRFNDAGIHMQRYSNNDEQHAYLIVVITPSRNAMAGTPVATSRLRTFSNATSDYLATSFNATTNPNALYDVSLSFKAGNIGSRFISRAESHDFARYNSTIVNSAGKLEWTTMLHAVNGVEFMIADVIYNAFNQHMSMLSKTSQANEEE
jgi:hypothetical protein